MQASLRFSKSGVTVMRLAEMRPADANLESHKVRLPLETRAMSTERPQALVSGAHICLRSQANVPMLYSGSCH